MYFSLQIPCLTVPGIIFFINIKANFKLTDRLIDWSLLTHLPKHIYDWDIEVWGQLDVAFSTAIKFKLSTNWIND